MDNCRHEGGYYILSRVIHGHVRTHYKKNGEYNEQENGDMYDGIFIKDLKTKYCENCNKKIK